MKKILSIIGAAILLGGCGTAQTTFDTQELLNVSYDPTRELYAAYNDRFKIHWESELVKGKVVLNHTHAGSGKQARSVIEGVEADVVTLALAYDVTAIKNAGLIRGGWRREFPDNSSPYTSTIVFLVRAGNPKNIRDWDDLIRSGVEIVTPNPKTSGGAQWNYLAAWEFARRNLSDDEEVIKDFMRKIFANVVALDDGARGSTKSFESGKGDVLIAWENEALLATKIYPDDYEIVTPSLSILAEPSVAIVDSVVDKKGTRELAEEYLNYLYSPEGQEIAAQNFYRPRDEEILKRYAETFKPLTLFTIDEAFGGWVKAHNEHFADGANFDKIMGQRD